MKKYLLPENGKFFKANLHCHSTFSDGSYTPQQIKDAYVKRGYSIVAFTDHDVLIPHDELKDEGFLPLHGFEMEMNENEEGAKGYKKTCHICFIALKKDYLIQPCYHRTEYMPLKSQPYRNMVKFDESLPDYEREYSPKCINDVIKTAREKGFFITYNHPVWSLEDYSDYINYHGMNAMEICNYGCVAEGFDEYNTKVYDDMLRHGERIFCTATDDNHNRKAADDPRFDSFGGFVWIKAEKLDYETITDALIKGNFYASQGPEIYELYYENGEVHIKCSPAREISLSACKRPFKAVFAKDGELLTEATFTVAPDQIYFRITVTDEKGKHANTSAYFLDELNK